MKDTALIEAGQAGLPSFKPNRRKRIALRFAVLVTAVSVLGAAYWFTRPPELIWWRSAPIGKSGRHVKALIPSGWGIEEESSSTIDLTGTSLLSYVAYPSDKRPAFLRRILPRRQEVAALLIFINSDIGRNHAADRPRLFTRPIAGAAALRAKSKAITYGV